MTDLSEDNLRTADLAQAWLETRSKKVSVDPVMLRLGLKRCAEVIRDLLSERAKTGDLVQQSKDALMIASGLNRDHRLEYLEAFVREIAALAPEPSAQKGETK